MLESIRIFCASLRNYFWIDPEDGIAVVNFEALLPALNRAANLQSLITELLTYEWLPVEGRDFRVTYETSAVNGALLESATFSPAN